MARDNRDAESLKRMDFMAIALQEAEAAGKRGEIPVGAVIAARESVVAKSGNRTRELADPTAHAEMLVIREACLTLSQERLANLDLYVTLEPCTMCAAAISYARLRRLYYGATDDKGGAVASGVRFFTSPTCHHMPDVYPGIAEIEAATMLKMFFRARRD